MIIVNSMKKFILLFICCVLFQVTAYATYLCPNGTYVNEGPCVLCPDGSYIGAGATCQLAPNGSYVPESQGGPQIQPNGQYLPSNGSGNSNSILCPDGSYVNGNRCELTPDGHYVGAY